MNKIFVIMLCFLMAGCGTNGFKKVPLLPIMEHPAIKIPKMPPYPIHKLNAQSKPDEVMKSYVASLHQCDSYRRTQLEIWKINYAVNKSVQD